MNIVHITSAHPANDIRILIKECNALAAHGHHVTLLHAKSENFKNEFGVQLVGLKLTTTGRLSRFTKVVNAIANYACSLKADVYHLHDPELIRIIPRLKSTGAKVIFDAHENLPKQIATKKWIPNALKGITSWLVTRIMKYYCSKCDGIITVNSLLVKTYAKINKNTIAIHNYPLLSEFDISTQLTVLGDDVIYVGGLMESRGIINILEAFKDIDLTLKLAGKFENETFHHTCEQHISWSKVNYLGFLNRAEVAKAISNSLCGLLLLKPYESYLESTPIKLFEYMAAGIPVIASDFPYWRSILNGYDCVYWVDANDIESIKKVIVELFNNKSNALLKGQVGKRAVIEKFNWEAEQKNLLEYYDTLQ
jgi:glycosyltransferase involved in cell wall biosynthesis